MNNILKVTDKATFQLKKIIEKGPSGTVGVVVGIDKSGCNGYSYKLDFAKKTDGLDILTPWDLPYYSNRYKKEFYNFDDESLRPYFKSENVINGVFDVANKLYGLNFEKLDTVDKFHDEVCVYKVTDLEDKYIGLLYQDIHPRSTKRGGAWMNQLRAQGLNGDTVDCPHVTFNCNLTKSTPDKPALLSLSEVRTIFHEFGKLLRNIAIFKKQLS